MPDPLAFDERYLTAIHEAGHAVAAAVLRKRLGRPKIYDVPKKIETPDGSRILRFGISSVRLKPSRRFKAPDGTSWGWPTRWCPWLEREIVVGISGPMAERFVRVLSGELTERAALTASVGDFTDRPTARWLAAKVYRHRPGREGRKMIQQRLHEAHAASRRLVVDNWPAIEVVARLLYKIGSLGSRDVRRFVRHFQATSDGQAGQSAHAMTVESLTEWKRDVECLNL